MVFCYLLVYRASDNLLNIESITPKIMILELEGNPKTTIVCANSPHNSSTLEELEDFYTSLRSTVEQVPSHNLLVIAGDSNGKLRSDDVNFTYNKENNRNGEMLLDFLEEFNLFGPTPTGRIRTYKLTLFSVSLSVSVRQFLSETAHWNFLIFGLHHRWMDLWNLPRLSVRISVTRYLGDRSLLFPDTWQLGRT